MKNNIVSISEYGYIGYGENFRENSNFISKKVKPNQFKELEEFHKNNPGIFEYANPNLLKSNGNYVGVIQTPSLTLEILPKVYNGNDEARFRRIFLDMLLKIDEIPSAKDGTKADVDIENLNIFEVFIKLFIEQIDNLIKKGIKSDYILNEDNLFYLKGKLKFSKHLKYNLVHKERFYVEFDEYKEDRAENRILKTCIKFLLNVSKDFENQKWLRQQLFFFEDVSDSVNLEYDLSCIEYIQRGMEHYELPLKFANIFLDNKSFAPIKGDNSSFSLLFQMNVIFERYVEVLLKEGGYKIKTNFNKTNLLIDENKSDKQISLEPDYLIEEKIIGDAKWKLYDNENKNELKREDIFQIYSYMHYFGAKVGYVFAPKIFTNDKKETLYYFQQLKKQTDYKLIVYFIDLENDNEIKLNQTQSCQKDSL